MQRNEKDWIAGLSAGYTSTSLIQVHNCPLFACILEGRKRDTVSSSKEVADSVCLDPGRAGIVLFVLGDVLCLLPKFRLRRHAYSAYLDPWCAGICPVYLG
jgi:hypothetical protein